MVEQQFSAAELQLDIPFDSGQDAPKKLFPHGRYRVVYMNMGGEYVIQELSKASRIYLLRCSGLPN